MTVLSIDDFNNRASSGKNSIEKIYEGKIFVPGPIFSLQFIDAAISYCDDFEQQEANATCLIVKDKSFLRVWTEEHTSDSAKSLDYVSANDEFFNACQKSLAEYLGPIAPIICKKALKKNTQLTPEKFIEILATKISDSQDAEKFKKSVLKDIKYF